MSVWQAKRGFTLLEVLVALAVLAVALAAAMRMAALATDTAGQVRLRVLANWVAENQLVTLRNGVWPSVGRRNGEAQQAGVTLGWEEVVSGTPNPNFRRVQVRVYDPAQPDYAWAEVVAFLPSQR